MAAPIGPGDWVECVDDSGLYPQMPKGSLWCVEAVLPGQYACEVHGGSRVPNLKLAGDPDWDWALCCYRPIYRPKASIIDALKAPPERVGEPA